MSRCNVPERARGKVLYAEKGWLGVLTGGLTATAGGITAAVVSAVIMALIFKAGDKR